MTTRVRRCEAEQMASLMLSATRELMPLDDSSMANFPIGQLRVCAILCGGPQAMSALGAELRVSLSAMTQTANRLERAGLVRRISAEHDRRVRRLTLTPRGQRLMAEREQERVARMTSVLNRLSPTARTRVMDAFCLLAEACAAAHAARCAAPPRRPLQRSHAVSRSRKRLP